MIGPVPIFTHLSATLAGVALTAVFAFPTIRDAGVREGGASARAQATIAAAQEALRQRESVRAAEDALDLRMSDLTAQIDAARPGRDKELLRYEQDRTASGRICPLGAADVDWLLRF